MNRHLRKAYYTLTLFAFSAIPLTAFSSNKTPSSIDNVTVYTQGALITRTAQLDLQAGDQTVQITGFPTNMEPGSFRVEIDNKAVRVGQISTKKIVYRKSQDQDVANLEQQIEALDKKIRLQNDVAKSANLQLKLLDSLATGYGKEASVGLAQGQASTSGWQQALNLMQSGSAKAYQTLRQTDDAIVALNEERDLLALKLKNKRDQAKVSTNVVLALNAKTALTALAKIQYSQESANWEPAYEARLDTASGRLVVSQKAVVNQRTSEAWSNVKLTLSTSEPDEETQVPEVSSEFYTLVKPRPMQTARMRNQAPMASSSDAFLEEVVVTGAVTSNQWSGNYALSFPIPGRVDVSNDLDQTQRYDLQRFEFDSELVTQIAPTESSKAYLAARFTHSGSVPLYGSDMLVFVDGTFSGTAEMPTILPGKETTMPMGQDPRIEVRTIDLAAQNNQSGIFKKQNVSAYDDVFEIINRRPNTASIEVRSAFPVSKHKSLKVKVGDDSTPPSEQDADDLKGVAIWRKDVEPNETWKIRSQYTVTYPTDHILRRTYQ